MMKTIQLGEKEEFTNDFKVQKIFIQFKDFLNEVNQKELPIKTIKIINKNIEELNATSIVGKDFQKLIKKKQSNITKLLEKEHKIVPRNYYRNLWVALGMTAIGLPIGVILGLMIGNIGLLASGLPIGMLIGFAVGSGMDKKASEEGRQLDIEI